MPRAFRRMLPLLLSLCLLLALPCAALAEEPAALTFGEDGTFEILLLADTQDAGTPEPAMLALEQGALDQTAPDLVVFLGDQVHGPTAGGEDAVFSVIDAIVQPVVDRGIPFAFVYGNHDDEGGVNKEAQLLHYQSFPGCLATKGSVSGCGNYNLLVYGKDGLPKCNLVFFDSGTYAADGAYDYVKQDQLDWFVGVCEAATAENNGEPVATYVFQHIIVPEIYDALAAAEQGGEGAIEGHGSHGGSYFRLDPASAAEGYLFEAPCPPDVNGGEFAAMQAQGVTAAFFGHDHVNSFRCTYEGIDLVAVPGMTFYIYGHPDYHGVRTLTLREDAPAAYTTALHFYDELTDAPMPGLLVPANGRLVQTYILLGVGVLLVLIAAAIVLIVSLRRRKKRKAAANA